MICLVTLGPIGPAGIPGQPGKSASDKLAIEVLLHEIQVHSKYD